MLPRLLKLQSSAEKNYVKGAKMALEIVNNHSEHQKVAYVMANAWLNMPDEDKTPLINKLGGLFAELEIPDAHVAGDVDKKWAEIAELVEQNNQATT